ncbi:TetR family transcriptional regulator C-terminal domain-containing protein [Gorillibacterium sp. CAU 1737]|uniref:TetR/AcrR family transcriptional regulator n=1 Tax=Gorillibacterium sp. CAU 1737 TaxID=3140362 RepID=UPI0032612C48
MAQAIPLIKTLQSIQLYDFDPSQFIMNIYSIQVYHFVVSAFFFCYNEDMVKRVDHTQRKIEIAEAAWRVILRDGVQAATVRNIAAEAGLTLGALRHYFSVQEELLAFAMKLVQERVGARVRSLYPLAMPPKEKATRLLLELLPTTAEKMTELEVWFSFTFQKLAASSDSSSIEPDGILWLVTRVMDDLEEAGALRPDLNKELEAERLYAVVDGLALHALMEPGRLSSDTITAILSAHLDHLCLSDSLGTEPPQPQKSS